MRVLALSPHTDDVELGCGGYLDKAGDGFAVICFSRVFNGVNLYKEFKASMETLRVDEYVCHKFPAREFNEYRQAILDKMLEAKDYFSPKIVLIPSASDSHQDHQVIHEEAVRAFSKDCCVLAYELPWNCRGFKPNYFVWLNYYSVAKKWQSLKCYKSQIKLGRPYFTKEFIESLARVRGQQIKKEFAEAFEVITWID